MALQTHGVVPRNNYEMDLSQMTDDMGIRNPVLNSIVAPDNENEKIMRSEFENIGKMARFKINSKS